jgi:hypothetical protein
VVDTTGVRAQNRNSMANQTAAALMAALICWPSSASSADDLRRATVWDLKIGQPVAAQPAPDEFRGFACGSNGGPPRRRIAGWSDYMGCRPEASGLHEVYFEYDDEYEYVARARDLPREIARWSGTTEAGFPVVVSALFDDTGVLGAVRIVTDPRPDHRNEVVDADVRKRADAHLFGQLMAARFDIDPATQCRAQPAADGESAIGSIFVKQSCEATDAGRGRKVIVAANFFRKRGQSGTNPQLPTQLTQGQFESSARVEIHRLDP